MATRVDWKLSVTPIIGLADVTEGASGAEVLSADIKGTVGGGNSSGTWAGSNVSEFDAGKCTHVSSASVSVTTSSTNGVFIKNSGFDYDATVTTGNNINRGTTTVAEDASETVNVTIGATDPAAGLIIAKLKGGECIYLSSPADGVVITAPASGSNPIAVQVATLA